MLPNYPLYREGGGAAGGVNSNLPRLESWALYPPCFCPNFAQHFQRTLHIYQQGVFPHPSKAERHLGGSLWQIGTQVTAQYRSQFSARKYLYFQMLKSLVPFEVRGFLISLETIPFLSWRPWPMAHRSWIKERSGSFKSCPNKCHQSCTPFYTQQILIIYSPDWFHVIVIIAIEQLTDLYFIYMYNNFI